MATRRTASKSEGSTNGTGSARKTKAQPAKDGATTNGSASTTGRGRSRTRTSEASAAGATARAWIAAARRGSKTSPRRKAAADKSSSTEPTVTATDEVLAASNAQRAVSPDMPRVAWLRTQLQNLEAEWTSG